MVRSLLLSAFAAPVAIADSLTDAYCTPGSQCWPLKQIHDLEASLSEGALLHGSQTALSLYLFCHTPGAFNASQRAGHTAPALNPAFCGEALYMNVSDVAVKYAPVEASSYTMNVARYKAPGLIVRAKTVEDVLHTVDFARNNNVRLAVRNTGHAYNGQSSAEGGVVLDVSNFADVSLDVDAETLTCGGGSTWGPVYQAANEKGFTVVGGHDPTVGVVGCMMGACHGEFTRQHGYSADNVVEMQVVLPSKDAASVVTVNEESNPELFWAMRGGGPGFGIVMRVTMRMHKAPPSLYVYALVGDILSPTQSATSPLCPGLAKAKNATDWWAKHGAASLKTITMNASWWSALPTGFSAYGNQCTFGLFYAGDDLERDMKSQAIEDLKHAMGPRSLLLKTASYKTQAALHIAQADQSNYVYQAFSSYVPAPEEMDETANVLADLFASGELTSISYNGVLGGEAMKPRDNAVGSVLRRAVSKELTIGGCQSASCQGALAKVGQTMDKVDYLYFESLDRTMQRLQRTIRGKYINEWVSKAGLAFPTVNNFWDNNVYQRLLKIKQSVDPCNVLTVEAGVAADRPHCQSAARGIVLV